MEKDDNYQLQDDTNDTISSLELTSSITGNKRKSRSANLTHEQKRLICLHAKQHPTLTQAQLGEWTKERFDLDKAPSQSAISHTLRTRLRFKHLRSEDWSSKRMRTVRYPQLDIALANWFLYCQARQIKVQGDAIKAKAQKYYQMIGNESAKNNDAPTFSNGWLHSFQSRHGFTRSPNNYANDPHCITNQLELQTALASIAPNDLYYMDETRLFYSNYPLQLNDINSQPQLMLLWCCNANGTDAMDPFIITQQVIDVNKTAENEIDFSYTVNQDAWITPTIFREWLLAFDWRMHELNRQIVLLLDDISYHQVKKMALKNITIRFINVHAIGSDTNMRIKNLTGIETSTSSPGITIDTSWTNPERSNMDTNTSFSLVESLENGVIKHWKLRYRIKQLELALARLSEQPELSDPSHIETLFHVDLYQAIQWILSSWREIPSTLIQEKFYQLGINSLQVPMHEVTDGELLSQVATLLTQVQQQSELDSEQTMRWLYPIEEIVIDRELQDEDFVRCAVTGFQGVMFVGKSGRESSKSARLPSTPRKSKQFTSIDMQKNNINAQLNGLEISLTNGNGLDEQTDELRALEIVHRLAVEKNCDQRTINELGRLLAERVYQDISGDNNEKGQYV